MGKAVQYVIAPNHAHERLDVHGDLRESEHREAETPPHDGLYHDSGAQVKWGKWHRLLSVPSISVIIGCDPDAPPDPNPKIPHRAATKFPEDIS
jgi:hypothetical protein